jgi:hypothetical protein
MKSLWSLLPWQSSERMHIVERWFFERLAYTTVRIAVPVRTVYAVKTGPVYSFCHGEKLNGRLILQVTRSTITPSSP